MMKTPRPFRSEGVRVVLLLQLCQAAVGIGTEPEARAVVFGELDSDVLTLASWPIWLDGERPALFSVSLSGDECEKLSLPGISLKVTRGAVVSRSGRVAWLLGWGGMWSPGVREVYTYIWRIGWEDRIDRQKTPCPALDALLAAVDRANQTLDEVEYVEIRKRFGNLAKLDPIDLSERMCDPKVPLKKDPTIIQTWEGWRVGPIDRLFFASSEDGTRVFPNVGIVAVDERRMYLVFSRAGMAEVWSAEIEMTCDEKKKEEDLEELLWRRLWHGETTGTGAIVPYLHGNRLVVVAASGDVEVFDLQKHTADRISASTSAPVSAFLKSQNGSYILSNAERSWRYHRLSEDGVTSEAAIVPGMPGSPIDALRILAKAISP